MLLKMYTIYDSKVEAYNRPFYARSHGEALRIFEDEVNRGDSPMAAHPGDFSLFSLGEFDDNTSSIELESVPVCLAKAHELLRSGDNA